jgi:hypothetical protein
MTRNFSLFSDLFSRLKAVCFQFSLFSPPYRGDKHENTKTGLQPALLTEPAQRPTPPTFHPEITAAPPGGRAATTHLAAEEKFS